MQVGKDFLERSKKRGGRFLDYITEANTCFCINPPRKNTSTCSDGAHSGQIKKSRGAGVLSGIVVGLMSQRGGLSQLAFFAWEEKGPGSSGTHVD